MSKEKLTIGTRGSTLALWQADYVAELLRRNQPGLSIEIQIIKTKGDLVRDRALSQVGGKGLFVKEIEQALLSGDIDLAVHSLKDMPTEQPEGLTLGAILDRADPRDALVVRDEEQSLATLPSGARVGTSSLRRRSQVLSVRPDLQILDLRGNVDTRLRKLREGQYEAVVLAAAGLVRLGHAGAIRQILPVDVMLPAVGQGALCVEARAGDQVTGCLLSRLDHRPTRQATQAERSLLKCLEGGCQVPIGAFAEVDGDRLHLRGLVASLDGRRLVRDEIQGLASDAEGIGRELAERILGAGGRAILEEIERGS